MTMEDNSNNNENNNESGGTSEGGADASIDALRAEQWQAFVANMAQQNQVLSAQLAQTENALVATNQRTVQEQRSKMTPEERADALQTELDTIRTTATQAYQNQVSTDVWRRRDAEAAARILRLSGLDVNNPKLYRGDWDQNWMPRFVASVEAVSAERRNGNGNGGDPRENPGNRANVGTSVGNSIPEIDPNADGPTTIRFALQKLAGERK